MAAYGRRPRRLRLPPITPAARPPGRRRPTSRRRAGESDRGPISLQQSPAEPVQLVGDGDETVRMPMRLEERVGERHEPCPRLPLGQSLTKFPVDQPPPARTSHRHADRVLGDRVEFQRGEPAPYLVDKLEVFVVQVGDTGFGNTEADRRRVEEIA